MRLSASGSGRRLRRLLFFITVLLASLTGNIAGQQPGDYGSAGPGPANWSVPGSWVIFPAAGGWAAATPASTPPSGTRNVWVRSGHTITLDVDASCNNLTVEATGQITGSRLLSINGNLALDGTIITDQPIDFYGNGPGNILTGTGSIRMANLILPSAVRFHANATIESGSHLTIEPDILYVGNNLTITNKAFVEVWGNVNVNNSVFTAQWINAANSYLAIGGNIGTNIALNASATGNTVSYNGTANQFINVPVGSYYTLMATTAGEKTLRGSIGISQNLYITGSDVIFDCLQYQVTGSTTGICQITGSTLRLGNPSSNIAVAFPLNYSNVQLDVTSTVIYRSAGNQIIAAVSGGYGNLGTATSGTKSFTGYTTVNGNLTIGASTVLDANGFNLVLKGNWTDNGSFLPRTGTVSLMGETLVQNISRAGGETFYELIINSIPGVSLSNNVNISNQLRMISGNITTGPANVLYLSTFSPASLFHNSGIIIGKFQRGVRDIGEYLFPVGNTSGAQTYYRPASITFSSNISQNTIIAEFIGTPPGGYVPYTDNTSGTVLLDRIANEGFWHFQASAPLADPFYLSLRGEGFTTVIDNNTRITGRTLENTTWRSIGIHGTVSPPIVTRSSISDLNSLSFDFTFARASCATIGGQARTAQTICSGTLPADLTLTGQNGNVVRWESSSNSGFVPVSSTYNIASATLPGTTIGPLTSSMYFRAIVKDGTCEELPSDPVLVTVLPIPSLTMVTQSAPVCNRNQATINLAGMLPNSTSTVVYSVGGIAQDPVTNVSSDINGNAVFQTVTLSTSHNGQTLSIISITTTNSTPNCTRNFNPGEFALTLSVASDMVPGTIGSNQSVCTGGDPAPLTELTPASGGLGTYSYQWRSSTVSGSGYSDISGAQGPAYDPPAGALVTTYYVRTVTSLCGSVSTPEVAVTVAAQPTWNTYSFPVTSICQGSQVTFSATVSGGLGGTVSWIRSTTPGGSGVTVISSDTPPLAGKYYYRPQYAATGSACTLADGTETEVTVAPGPIWTDYSFPVTEICIGSQVTFSVNVSGGLGGTVKWIRSTTAGGAGITVTSPDSPTSAGTYYYRPQLEASGQGCGSADGQETKVTVAAQPSWNLVNLSATQICKGGQVNLSATVNGGLGGTVTWIRSSTPGGTGQEVSSPDSPPVTGTYYYRPRYSATGQGCSLTDGTETMVTVAEQPAWNTNTVPVTSICLGGTVTFSASVSGGFGGSIRWVRSSTPTGTGTVVTSPDIPLSIGTIYYRPQYTATGQGCALADGNATAVTVTVPPAWSGLSVPVRSICVGSQVTFSVGVTGGLTGTITWIRAVSPGQPGTLVTSPDTPPAAGTYYYRPHYTTTAPGCSLNDGPETAVTVAAQPAWNTANFPVRQICIGSQVSFSTSVNGGLGGTISWIRSASSGGSGQVVTSPDTPPAQGTYYYRPQYAATGQGCSLTDGPETAVTVSAQPSWTGYDFPITSICRGSQVAFSVSVTGGLGGTIRWVRSTTSGGTGTVVTSPDTPPASGTYYYRPQYSATGQGCSLADGSETIVTVAAQPSWTGYSVPVRSLCVGSQVRFDVSITGGLGGTIEWIRSESPGQDGIVVSSPDTPAAPGIYYYRPRYAATGQGCSLSDGTETAVTVVAQPSWSGYSFPVTSICFNERVNFSANVDGGLGGTISWIRSLSPGGTGVTVTSPDSPPAAGTYYYRPRYSATGPGCNLGDGQETAVTVNPLPAGLSMPSIQTICSNTGMQTIVLSTSNGMNSITSYAWTRDNTTRVTGTSSGTGDINVNLRNITGTDQAVVFTVVPTSDFGCRGASFPATVTVRSEPVATHSTVTRAACTNLAIDAVTLSTNNSMNAVTSFAWTRDNTTNVTGPSSGTGNITGTLVNVTDQYQVVKYTVTPTSDRGCAGDTIMVNLAVNPVPKVIPVNPNMMKDTSICSVSSTSIKLTSPSSMTSGEIQFDYTVTVPGTVFGSNLPETGRSPGYTIERTYRNNSNTIQSVYFDITPRVSTGICPAGITVRSEVKVHPATIQYTLPAGDPDGNGIEIVKPFTCGGSSNAILRIYPSIGAGPYQYAWSNQTYDTIKIFDNNSVSIQYSGRWDVIVTDHLGCKNTSSQWVSAAKVFDSYLYVVDSTGYGTTCAGSIDGELWVRENLTSAGRAPFEYWITWNGQDTSAAIIHNTNVPKGELQRWTGLPAGTYSLYMKDADGCYNTMPPGAEITSPDSIKVQFDPFVYPGGYNVTCNGSTDSKVSVTSVTGGNKGYTFQWYRDAGLLNPLSGQTNKDLLGMPAGTYWLRTTDRKGCFNAQGVTITQPPPIVVTDTVLSKSAFGNRNISCHGLSEGSIAVTVAGGSGGYSYSWSGPAGYSSSLKDIANLRAGTYTLSVRDNAGCQMSPPQSYTLTEPDSIIIVPIISTYAGGYAIACNGSATGKVTTTVTGGTNSGYTYTWTTSNGSGIVQGQKDQSALTAGTYTLTVRDLNGCENSKSILLNQPEPLLLNIVPSNISCQSMGSINLSVTGGVGPMKYSWSNGATTEDITGLSEGDYKVTVTDANGCSKTSETIRISRPAELTYTKDIPVYNGFNIHCHGNADGSISIVMTSGQPPYDFKWTGPNGFTSSAKDLTGLKAGTYNLLITDSNKCVASETFTLTEPGKFEMTFILSQSLAGNFNINCAGTRTGTIDVSPINPVMPVTSYRWSDGNNSKSRTGLPAGTYGVIITDSNGCIADSTVDVTEPDSLKLHLDVLRKPTCPDKPDGELRAVVSGGVIATDYKYLWSDNSTGSSISGLTEGFYKVTVTDLNNCTRRDSVNLSAVRETCLIIPNAITPNNDLYNDTWNIGLTELYPDLEIKIFNRWGQEVWRSAKGYPDPWDGRDSRGGRLPVDSYHYIINLHNGSKPLLGNVTIVTTK